MNNSFWCEITWIRFNVETWNETIKIPKRHSKFQMFFLFFWRDFECNAIFLISFRLRFTFCAFWCTIWYIPFLFLLWLLLFFVCLPYFCRDFEVWDWGIANCHNNFVWLYVKYVAQLHTTIYEDEAKKKKTEKNEQTRNDIENMTNENGNEKKIILFEIWKIQQKNRRQNAKVNFAPKIKTHHQIQQWERKRKESVKDRRMKNKKLFGWSFTKDLIHMHTHTHIRNVCIITNRYFGWHGTWIISLLTSDWIKYFWLQIFGCFQVPTIVFVSENEPKTLRNGKQNAASNKRKTFQDPDELEKLRKVQNRTVEI